jgi:hypothetical protein
MNIINAGGTAWLGVGEAEGDMPTGSNKNIKNDTNKRASCDTLSLIALIYR